MLISVKKLKTLYQQAQEYKGDVRDSLNETYKYTDPFFEIKDSGKKEKLERRKVDSTTLVSIRFLVNFIMTSMFSRSGTWAMLKVNKAAYSEIFGDDGEVTTANIQAIDKSMEKNSETVYQTNENTNYYTETAKALKDCCVVGTGVRKTVELKSTTKPFTYEYINLDNFYYLEDSFGQPTVTFKVYPEKTLAQLNDMFGHIEGWKAPSKLEDEEDLKKTVNVIECCIPDFDEDNSITSFIHAVYTDGFDELLVEEVLKRNPFRVFRFAVDSSNPWGIGIGRENIDLFKDLETFKKTRSEHAEKIVDPPGNFKGNIDLIYKASFEAGARNYAGDGLSAENDMGYQPINIGGSLIPLDQDIADCRQRIREVFMAQPLGDVIDTKNRTATEMSIRHEMFRKEFSGAYELLNTELLQYTFLDAYIIMQEKGLLDNTLENEDDNKGYKYLEFSQINYINELTKSAGAEEVMNVVNWYSVNAQLVPEERRQYLLKIGEFTKWSAEKMMIPLEVINTPEEINAMIAQQQKIEQLQALSQVQSEPLQGQVEHVAENLGGDM